jgi:hypothetical protein
VHERAIECRVGIAAQFLTLLRLRKWGRGLSR